MYAFTRYLRSRLAWFDTASPHHSGARRGLISYSTYRIYGSAAIRALFIMLSKNEAIHILEPVVQLLNMSYCDVSCVIWHGSTFHVVTWFTLAFGLHVQVTIATFRAVALYILTVCVHESVCYHFIFSHLPYSFILLHAFHFVNYFF